MSKSSILNKIRTRLGGENNVTRGRQLTDAHIQAQKANLIPLRAADSKDHLDDLFKTEAETVTTTVEHVKRFDDVPNHVARYLSERNLPTAVRIAPHPDLLACAWNKETMLAATPGLPTGDDEVSVTRALAGVAETGTLVMTSGPETPTTLNFLPLNNIAVVRKSEIKGTYEDVWTQIRSLATDSTGDTKLPRTVNWITGPSRSADIEQTMLLGAHGPQRLHILIVDE